MVVKEKEILFVEAVEPGKLILFINVFAWYHCAVLLLNMVHHIELAAWHQRSV